MDYTCPHNQYSLTSDRLMSTTSSSYAQLVNKIDYINRMNLNKELRDNVSNINVYKDQADIMARNIFKAPSDTIDVDRYVTAQRMDNIPTDCQGEWSEWKNGSYSSYCFANGKYDPCSDWTREYTILREKDGVTGKDCQIIGDNGQFVDVSKTKNAKFLNQKMKCYSLDNSFGSKNNIELMKQIIKNKNIYNNRNPIDDFDPNKLTESYLDKYKEKYTFDDCISYKQSYENDMNIGNNCLSKIIESFDSGEPSPSPSGEPSPSPSGEPSPSPSGEPSPSPSGEPSPSPSGEPSPSPSGEPSPSPSGEPSPSPSGEPSPSPSGEPSPSPSGEPSPSPSGEPSPSPSGEPSPSPSGEPSPSPSPGEIETPQSQPEPSNADTMTDKCSAIMNYKNTLESMLEPSEKKSYDKCVTRAFTDMNIQYKMYSESEGNQKYPMKPGYIESICSSLTNSNEPQPAPVDQDTVETYQNYHYNTNYMGGEFMSLANFPDDMGTYVDMDLQRDIGNNRQWCDLRLYSTDDNIPGNQASYVDNTNKSSYPYIPSETYACNLTNSSFTNDSDKEKYCCIDIGYVKADYTIDDILYRLYNYKSSSNSNIEKPTTENFNGSYTIIPGMLIDSALINYLRQQNENFNKGDDKHYEMQTLLNYIVQHKTSNDNYKYFDFKLLFDILFGKGHWPDQSYNYVGHHQNPDSNTTYGYTRRNITQWKNIRSPKITQVHIDETDNLVRWPREKDITLNDSAYPVLGSFRSYGDPAKYIDNKYLGILNPSQITKVNDSGYNSKKRPFSKRSFINTMIEPHISLIGSTVKDKMTFGYDIYKECMDEIYDDDDDDKMQYTPTSGGPKAYLDTATTSYWNTFHDKYNNYNDPSRYPFTPFHEDSELNQNNLAYAPYYFTNPSVQINAERTSTDAESNGLQNGPPIPLDTEDDNNEKLRKFYKCAYKRLNELTP
jgi:hypothetical protein